MGTSTTSRTPSPLPIQRVAATSSPPTDRAARTTHLFLAVAEASSDRERHELREEIVTLHLGVAASVAARYRSRGISGEDLRQVAYLALVKAVNGYDVHAGHSFLAYSVPTIRGEIKRHFRDFGWTVRPPRRVQELQAQITIATAELTAASGRAPRPSELAEHLDEPVEAVAEALATDGCFTPSSLDRPVGEDGDAVVSDLLGGDDPGQAAAEARVVLAPIVRRLSERDRRILMLRFFRGCTQQEIADDIGVTQMQVSRLLQRILADIRTGVDGDDDGDDGDGVASGRP